MTSRARILIAALRAFVLLFGAAALWFARDGMNPDGVAYLDASDVYLSGGWPAAGTGYWSPLYPTLLAVARLIAGRSAARELAIAQGVNFIVFLSAFAALEYFVREIRWATRARHPGALPNDTTWRTLVYALFGVLTIGWIGLWMLTPDLLVAAIVLAIAGVCVRLAIGRGRWPTVMMLGILLGLGYLAKAALFPFGVFVLGTLGVLLRRRRGGLAQVAAAAAIFLAASAPQIAYASRLKGSATFGDVGRLNYLWYVAKVPGPVSSAFPLPARLPSPAGTGQTLTPLDPVRDVHPAIYDIDAPIPGTLPIWYDAGYWYRGVIAPVLPLAIIRAIVRHVRVCLELFAVLLVGGVAAAVAGPVSWRTFLAMRPSPMLVVPAIAVIVMYMLVLVQSRYVASFALLLFAGLVPPWATDALSRRLRTGLAVGAVAAFLLAAYQARVDATYWRGSARARADVVAALDTRGVGSGSRIGFIGEAYDAMWARTARLRFVSLVPLAETQRFWELDAESRAAVLLHMQQHGAQAIVAESPAAGVNIDGWERLPSAGVPRPDLIVYAGPR
jgi:hypothetical protein